MVDIEVDGDIDPIILAARSYEKLLGKNFIITIDTNDGNNKKINVQFNKDNFYHLIGFQYLRDLPQLNTGKNKKNTIFNNVIKGIINYNQVKNSVHFTNKLEDRITYFHNIDKLLFEKVILDFDTRNLKFTSKLKCDYMFFKNKNGTYMHLSLGKEINHYPESFFVEHSDNYVKNQVKFNIISIEEVKKSNKKRI